MPAEESPRSLPPLPPCIPHPSVWLYVRVWIKDEWGFGRWKEGRRTKDVCAQKMLRYKSAKMCFSLFTVPCPRSCCSCRMPPTKAPLPISAPLLLHYFRCCLYSCAKRATPCSKCALAWLYPFLSASFYSFFWIRHSPRSLFVCGMDFKLSFNIHTEPQWVRFSSCHFSGPRQTQQDRKQLQL